MSLLEDNEIYPEVSEMSSVNNSDFFPKESEISSIKEYEIYLEEYLLNVCLKRNGGGEEGKVFNQMKALLSKDEKTKSQIDILLKNDNYCPNLLKFLTRDFVKNNTDEIMKITGMNSSIFEEIVKISEKNRTGGKTIVENIKEIAKYYYSKVGSDGIFGLYVVLSILLRAYTSGTILPRVVAELAMFSLTGLTYLTGKNTVKSIYNKQVRREAAENRDEGNKNYMIEGEKSYFKKLTDFIGFTKHFDKDTIEFENIDNEFRINDLEEKGVNFLILSNKSSENGKNHNIVSKDNIERAEVFLKCYKIIKGNCKKYDDFFNLGKREDYYPFSVYVSRREDNREFLSKEYIYCRDITITLRKLFLSVIASAFRYLAKRKDIYDDEILPFAIELNRRNYFKGFHNDINLKAEDLSLLWHDFLNEEENKQNKLNIYNILTDKEWNVKINDIPFFYFNFQDKNILLYPKRILTATQYVNPLLNLPSAYKIEIITDNNNINFEKTKNNMIKSMKFLN